MGPDTRHHLLPHERWFANLVLKQYRTRPSLTMLRLEQKYGPEGNILFSAAQANMLPGCLATCTAIVLVPFLSGREYLAVIALGLFIIGAPLIVGGGIRAIQSADAGRAFRGGRSSTTTAPPEP